MIYKIGGREVDPQTPHYQLLETIRTDEKIRNYVDNRIGGGREVEEEYETYYAQAKELAKEYWQDEMQPDLPGEWKHYYLCRVQHNPNLQLREVIKHISVYEEKSAPKMGKTLIGMMGSALLATLAQRFGVTRLISLVRRG